MIQLKRCYEKWVRTRSIFFVYFILIVWFLPYKVFYHPWIHQHFVVPRRRIGYCKYIIFDDCFFCWGTFVNVRIEPLVMQNDSRAARNTRQCSCARLILVPCIPLSLHSNGPYLYWHCHRLKLYNCDFFCWIMPNRFLRRKKMSSLFQQKYHKSYVSFRPEMNVYLSTTTLQ